MDIGTFHPQIVHFVVALLFVGVAFRLISLFDKPAFLNPAATTLLLLGAGATMLAVKSGDDAHGPAERIPGAREMVEHHEERGELTRNIFLGVALLELIALGLVAAKYRHVKVVRVASAVVGVVGLLVLTEAAGHGGDVVYSYAGGVGTRSGNPEDVGRLLRAGLYHQSRQDRADGRSGEAARLVEEMVRRFPADTEVALLAAESLIQDRRDGLAALEALSQITIAEDNRRLRFRHGLLVADAYVTAGLADSARVTLEALAEAYPTNETVQRRLTELR